MDAQEIAVVVGGLLLMGFVVWFFFMSEGARQTATASGGVQRVRITVKGGYTPDVVVAKRGVPLELDFYRDEANTCTDEVVFKDFRISRRLPAFETTTVRLLPEREGEFTFHCGMNRVRGKLVVEK